MKWLDNIREPAVVGCDLDGQKRLEVHRAILERKPMIRDVFLEFHRLFRALERRYFSGEGFLIELGSGASPVRDSFPEVLATDVVFSPSLDCVIDAQNMAFSDGSVKAIFGQNCFHHFPDPERFFEELQRILVPGGGAILIEPYFGPLAKWMYQRLFRTEGFDKDYPDWNAPVTGAMIGANQALSYIVFVRDHPQFRERFPNLKVVHMAPLGNYLRYLVSGGLNFRQLLPNFTIGLLKAVEHGLAGFNAYLALHHVVVLRKETGDTVSN